MIYLKFVHNEFKALFYLHVDKIEILLWSDALRQDTQ